METGGKATQNENAHDQMDILLSFERITEECRAQKTVGNETSQFDG